MSDWRAEDEYEVGYMKPPRDTRFKPGQSGNPRGRPRGRKSLKTMFTEMLDEKIEIVENGRRLKVSRAEAVLRAQYAKAMKGDTRAAQFMIRMAEEYSKQQPGENVVWLVSDSQMKRDEWVKKYGSGPAIDVTESE